MGEGRSIGLDVNARSVVAGVIDGGSGEVRSQRVPAGLDETVEWLRKLPAPVRVVYETRPTGYRLERACTEAGIGCVVAAPSMRRAFVARTSLPRPAWSSLTELREVLQPADCPAAVPRRHLAVDEADLRARHERGHLGDVSFAEAEGLAAQEHAID